MEPTRIANNRKNLYRLLIIVTLCMLFKDVAGEVLASTLETSARQMKDSIDGALSEAYAEVYEADTAYYVGELAPDALPLNNGEEPTEEVKSAEFTILDLIPESITAQSAKEPAFEYAFYNTDITYQIPNPDSRVLEEQNFIDGVAVRVYQYDSQTRISNATDYENFYLNYFIDETTTEAWGRVERALGDEQIVTASKSKLSSSYETLLPVGALNSESDFNEVLDLLNSNSNTFKTSFNVLGKYILSTKYESLRDFKGFIESKTDSLIAQDLTGELFFIQTDSSRTPQQTLNEVFFVHDTAYIPFGTNPRAVKVTISNTEGAPTAKVSEVDTFHYKPSESEDLADYISHDLLEELESLESENENNESAGE